MSDYLKHDIYSNSFLSRIKRELLGIPLIDQEGVPAFFEFGKEYEDVLQYDIHTNNPMIKSMVKETKKNSMYISLINHPKIKIQHEWYGKLMGLDFKAKADMVIKGYCVADIKSTSCNSLESFIESVLQYDYDRQVYIYMIVYKCPIGCIIATTKSKNPKVFIVPVFENDYIYNSGKAKAQHLVSVVKSL